MHWFLNSAKKKSVSKCDVISRSLCIRKKPSFIVLAKLFTITQYLHFSFYKQLHKKKMGRGEDNKYMGRVSTKLHFIRRSKQTLVLEDFCLMQEEELLEKEGRRVTFSLNWVNWEWSVSGDCPSRVETNLLCLCVVILEIMQAWKNVKRSGDESLFPVLLIEGNANQLLDDWHYLVHLCVIQGQNHAWLSLRHKIHKHFTKFPKYRKIQTLTYN